ncbi:MAG: DUF885 domain-containing protein, partial [Actinomycetota bacterium]
MAISQDGKKLSPVYQLSDDYIEQLAANDPGLATALGIAGHDHEMTDFSPKGHAERDSINRAAMKTLDTLDTSNDRDRLAAGVLRNSLEMSCLEYDAGEHLRSIRVIAGDVDSARSIFDLMPTATVENWRTIAERMQAVPAAFAGMRESWGLGIKRGIVAPRRQALAVAEQLETWAGKPAAPGFFTQFVETAKSVDGAPLEKLRQAAIDASQAMSETAQYLRQQYANSADPRNGVGEERHALARRRFMGMNIDAREAYQWGFAEVMRLDEELAKTAKEIQPNATLDEVRHFLDTDPQHSISGEENLREWLQSLMDDAMAFLIREKHFDIPKQIHRVEAMISPPGGAAAMYYTSPSEDLSRPGRTWYPANGRTKFPLWSEPTTAYHEGVPGHHLQVGMATVNSEKLSRFQRNEFVCGHGEGWALYAERLMDELGFLGKPEYRLGYLYAQAFRAARIVVDLGMHCELAIPKESKWHAGESWTPELALEFLSA